MRRVAHIMGMPISIDIPHTSDKAAFATVFKLLRQIDRAYSPYKSQSDVSKIQRGELVPAQYSTELRHIIDACRSFEDRTEGYFSANYNGVFDPSGYVKGWAIAQAGTLLEDLGHSTYLINAGGDVLATSNTEHVWRLGLQHPQDPTASMGTIAAKNLALATSGTYARGNHIFDPHNNKPAHQVLSATVIGPDIITADVFATTVCAMGTTRGLQFIYDQKGYEALIIAPDLTAHATPGFTNTPKTQTAQQ